MQDLKKQIEELAKEIKDIRKRGKTEVAEDVLRRILESMQMLKEDAGSPDIAGYGTLPISPCLLQACQSNILPVSSVNPFFKLTSP